MPLAGDLAFGIEPEKGSGSIHVEALSVSYP